MTWIKLPTGLIINMDNVDSLDINKITNPRDMFQVVCVQSGHRQVLAEELYQLEAAQKVIEAVLRAADITPVPVETDLRGFKRKVAAIPPELQKDED